MKFKYIFIYIFFLICSLLSSSCKHRTVQTLKPLSDYAYRVRRGHLDTILIDKTTPFDSLIKRLEKPWDWVETLAGYWIGYTDDMFSIASYGNQAIDPLMKFISNTNSQTGKIGALYTIHLIGINSTVVGRDHEEFKDTLARTTLLSYIEDPRLYSTSLDLLRRDPWLSDLQTYMRFLKHPTHNYSKLLLVLKRYRLKNIPFWQDLPIEINNKEIPVYHYGEFYNPISIMISLKLAFPKNVVIDQEIIDSPSYKVTINFLKKHGIEINLSQLKVNTNLEVTNIKVNNLLADFTNASYEGDLDYASSQYYYSVVKDTLYFYGPSKTRELLIHWWSNLPDSSKIKYSS
jgi:hypothetical protein